MKLSFKKLNQAGFSHIVLPLAFLAVGVGVVAFAGTRIVGSSSAATVADICGSGYSKQGEHYLNNAKTHEQAHFKVVVASKGSSKCIFTMGTDAAANETNYMVIDECVEKAGGGCAAGTYKAKAGTYKSRTPVVKFTYKANTYVYGRGDRNGNINEVGFFVGN